MSDMKKKVGKAGLKGLLNRKEPEPVESKFDSGSFRNEWEGDSYGDRDIIYGNRRGSGYGGGAGYGYGRPDYGRPVSSGSRHGYINATMDGDKAMVSDTEARRVSLELNGVMYEALRKRGLIVKLGREAVLTDFLNKIIFDGTLKYARTGGGFAVIKRDTWYEDELDGEGYDDE